MDYGGIDKRKTKRDLKKKRLNRGYKRGGQFRTHNISETGETSEESQKEGVNLKKKGKGKKKR